MMREQKSRDRETAYCRLVDMILCGKLAESTPLSERGLAEALGLYRTPVREAIRDLLREGVLEDHPTRGTFIRPLSLNDVREIYQVRVAIEGLAALLAAERAPTEELSEYGIAFQTALNTPDAFEVTQLHDHGAGFHVEIFRSAENKTLLEIYCPIRLRYRIAFGVPRHRSPQRVFESIQEHFEILKAIEEGDGERARQLMCDHLQKGLAFRTRLFASGGNEFIIRTDEAETPENRTCEAGELFQRQ